MKKGFLSTTSLTKSLIRFCMACFLAGSSMAQSEEIISVSRLQSTSDARIAVEKAWDVYHHAALGGTLASPTVQSHMESNLHKSRALLAEAYDAEERGDKKTTENLILKIIQIPHSVITGSQEPKQ